MGKLTALLSVYHKEGIVEFARELVNLGFDILSSGGTANALRQAEIPVRDVAELVGGGAILGHRVVTLSREVHAGLLARNTPEDSAELEKLGIPRIHLVCVDCYPLEKEVGREDATLESVLEKTDIGGPGMLRSGAKGRRIVLCDPEDRTKVIDWLKAGKPDEETYITALAAKAECYVAEYCLMSAMYHGKGRYGGVIGKLVSECKYGENAVQKPAGLYSDGSKDPLAVANFKVVAGTPPSYNNWCDVDRMLQTATHVAATFPADIAIAVKHGNACGAAFGQRPYRQPNEVLQMAIEGDMRAIFGGLLLTTFVIDEERAEIILTHKMREGRRLLDGIVAPVFTRGAIEMLKRKGDKCRFIQNSKLEHLNERTLDASQRFRNVRGGFLMQPNYTFVPNWDALQLHGDDTADIRLAWAICATSNSNTITLVKDGMLIGNGVGQQDRVGCCELALKRARDAGHDPKGALACSDSFFPFPDGPKVLIEAGIRAIFTTSGSLKDGETREACEKAGVRLYMLPDTEARGFFGH